jgi:hypothetical protein
MAEIINLRAAKKARTRKAARLQGNANAAKFGRTKAQKAAEKVQAERGARLLDGHQREVKAD